MPQHETPAFSDPEFATRIDKYGAFSEEKTKKYAQRESLAEEAERQEGLERLRIIAKEVAMAADKRVGTEPLYELQDKGAVRKFINNRGKKDLVEATEGWVIVSSSSDADVVKKSPGKATLTNSSGLGLVLTKDGRLYGSIVRQPLNPIGNRLTTVKRTGIERRTFMPKEASWLDANTALPRYRALKEDEEEKPVRVPTLLGDLSSPEGGLSNPYFTPYVVEQCYDALAKFVQDNDLMTPNAPADGEGPTQETSAREPDNEPPTEVFSEDAGVDPDNVIRGAFGSQPSERPRTRKGFSREAVSSVDQRVAAMRSQGLSNNEIYRNLVKEFHPDNGPADPMNEERIRYLNVLRHESLKKEK